MKPENQLSQTYQAVKSLLDFGWSGTYGDLAVAVGRTRRSGRIIGRLVKGYAKRHSTWPHSRVVTKCHGLPANH